MLKIVMLKNAKTMCSKNFVLKIQKFCVKNPKILC